MKQRHKSMIGMIGCGNMGQALIRGLTSSPKAGKVWVYDKQRSRLLKVKKAYKVSSAAKLDELIRRCQTLIIAVKPQDMTEVLKAIKKDYRKQLIISIAAGVSTSFIEKKVGLRSRVVRVMPNLAAKVSMSVSALAKGKYAAGSDLKKTEEIFDSVGVCLLLKERQIDAFTAVCGSGPGYVYYFMDALFKGARSLGLSPKKAGEMVIRTVIGASVLAASSGDDFEALAKRVASKGGTTEAAFKVFDKNKLKQTVIKATRAAALRAGALSK